MKAKISDKNAKLFSPVFKTILVGVQVNVTLKEFLGNPRKFINSGISYLYSNEVKLRAFLASTEKKAKPVVLDMGKASRGKVFNKPTKGEVSKAAAELIVEQVKRRARIEKRFKLNQAKAATDAKAKAATAAKAKAATDAKAAAAKAKAATDAKAKAKAKADAAK